MNARLILLSIFSLLPLNAADTAELSEFAMQELVENKNLMRHVDSNTLARTCMFVCKQWHDNMVAYRTAAVVAFNKEYPIDQIDQKKKIVLIKKDGSTVNIFTNSVIIDASGNFGIGVSDEVGGMRYKFDLFSKACAIGRHDRFFTTYKVKVTAAISNSMRTITLCKSEKNLKGHEQMGWGEINHGIFDDFENERTPISISLYLTDNGEPAYDSYFARETVCLQNNGTQLTNSVRYGLSSVNRRKKYDDLRIEAAKAKKTTNSSDLSISSKIKNFFIQFEGPL